MNRMLEAKELYNYLSCLKLRARVQSNGLHSFIQTWRLVNFFLLHVLIFNLNEGISKQPSEMKNNRDKSNNTIISTTTHSNRNAFKVPTRVLKLPICKQHDFIMNLSRLSFFHIRSNSHSGSNYSSSRSSCSSSNLLFSSSFTIYTREILFFFSECSVFEYVCVCVCVFVRKKCAKQERSSISFRKKHLFFVCRFTFSVICSELKRPPLFTCTRAG